MIYDTLSNIHLYEGIQPEIMRGLRYLSETDFSKLPDGRQDIDGDDLFASIQSYTTKAGDGTAEAHRDYIDIQYLISGAEQIGVAPLGAMEAEIEAHPERDVWFYRGDTEKLSLGGGRFIAVWPDDAHAPSVAANGTPTENRKCVVKVRLK